MYEEEFPSHRMKPKVLISKDMFNTLIDDAITSNRELSVNSVARCLGMPVFVVVADPYKHLPWIVDWLCPTLWSLRSMYYRYLSQICKPKRILILLFLKEQFVSLKYPTYHVIFIFYTKCTHVLTITYYLLHNP